jgi:hypothetical protein
MKVDAGGCGGVSRVFVWSSVLSSKCLTWGQTSSYLLKQALIPLHLFKLSTRIAAVLTLYSEV